MKTIKMSALVSRGQHYKEAFDAINRNPDILVTPIV
jgi:hypothetical protein